jgi:hypothetical protein
MVALMQRGHVAVLAAVQAGSSLYDCSARSLFKLKSVSLCLVCYTAVQAHWRPQGCRSSSHATLTTTRFTPWLQQRGQTSPPLLLPAPPWGGWAPTS